MRKPFFGVSDQVRHKQGCKGTGWKFQIEEVEELYYLCSENKGADQCRGYREADLRLSFRICKNPGFFHDAANFESPISTSEGAAIGRVYLVARKRIVSFRNSYF